MSKDTVSIKQVSTGQVVSVPQDVWKEAQEFIDATRSIKSANGAVASFQFNGEIDGSYYRCTITSNAPCDEYIEIKNETKEDDKVEKEFKQLIEEECERLYNENKVFEQLLDANRITRRRVRYSGMKVESRKGAYTRLHCENKYFKQLLEERLK